MSHNWGECYFDHFELFFENLSSRRIYDSGANTPSIQMLEYKGVFSGCQVFASLGLSQYSLILGRTCEVVVPTDAGWDVIPAIIANTLFHVIKQEMPFGTGIGISGIERICPEFTRAYNKHALYITRPYGLPDEFETLKFGDELGRVYLGIFISQPEFDYFAKFGVDKFEQLLQDKNVDPFHIARLSVV